jgi:hypothetical protein
MFRRMRQEAVEDFALVGQGPPNVSARICGLWSLEIQISTFKSIKS